MRHLLYSPLAWLLAASLLLWVWTAWQSLRRPANAEPGTRNAELGDRRSAISFQRFSISAFQLFLALFLPLWFFVYTLSTPLGSDSLRRSLTTHWPVPAEFSPDFILVAAMGYVPSGDHRADVLREGTAARIAEAVRWWEQHPHAFLVMQGSSGRPELGEDHQGRLMKRFATAYGVPEEQILLESRSRNTRGHVKYFREFEGVSADVPVGVVTSDWHMRRTAREFRSAFDNVHFRATYSPVVRSPAFRHLIPGERHLHASSMYLREWLAILYYRVRS